MMKRFLYSSFDGNKRGFTFVELMVVLVILTIAFGLFYTTFYYNWVMMETYTSRANLMQDADLIVEELTKDARNSRIADITCTPDTACVPSGASLTVNFAASGNKYTYGNNGNFIQQVGAGTRTLSNRIDFNNTSFQKVNGVLRVHLTLKEPLAGPDTAFDTWTYIFPRVE